MKSTNLLLPFTRILLIVQLLLGTLGVVQAQGPIGYCGFIEADSAFKSAHPELGTIDDFEQTMAKWHDQANIQPLNSSEEILVIPVIFHIIHNGNPVGVGFNISQERIDTLLKVLNEDFRRCNPDTMNTRAIFKNDAADSKIQFALAHIDKDGQSLTEPGKEPGIQRYSWMSLALAPPETGPGDKTGWRNTYVDEEIKRKTSWNPNEYFNIWIVDNYHLQFGLAPVKRAGYATFITPVNLLCFSQRNSIGPIYGAPAGLSRQIVSKRRSAPAHGFGTSNREHALKQYAVWTA
ncbi:MAG: hypothetical protein AAF399_21635 [Bacteroidota bacterium]